MLKQTDGAEYFGISYIVKHSIDVAGSTTNGTLALNSQLPVS